MRNYNNVEIKPETVTVTFTVAECGESHSLGAYHENILSIEEAIQIYHRIDPRRISGKPAIGVSLHVEGKEEWEDAQADFLTGRIIDVDYLNYVPELRDNPKVQEAVRKLIMAFPDHEVIAQESKEYMEKLSTYKPRSSIKERLMEKQREIDKDQGKRSKQQNRGGREICQ